MQCGINSATFRLWMYLMVPLFFKKQNSNFKKLKTKVFVFVWIYIWELISIHHTLEKINWLPVSNKVEYCIANTAIKYWNRIVPEYIFMKCLSLYSARQSENKNRAKKLTFLEWKIWSKINRSILKHPFLLCMLLRKMFYFLSKYKLIQIITTFFWLILGNKNAPRKNVPRKITPWKLLPGKLSPRKIVPRKLP